VQKELGLPLRSKLTEQMLKRTTERLNTQLHAYLLSTLLPVQFQLFKIGTHVLPNSQLVHLMFSTHGLTA